MFFVNKALRFINKKNFNEETLKSISVIFCLRKCNFNVIFNYGK